ncbi:MAG TPA: MurR/RpiR family transcriptional regulator, partial [Pseudomonas sp.]
MDKSPFLDALEQRFSDLTPTGKRIAGYLLANPQKLPFETA